MTAASITSSASPFELLRVKPLKDRLAQQQQGDTSDDAAKAPSNDILRMLQGVLQPKAKSQPDGAASAAATSQTDAVFAEVQVNGKTLATIYNSGAVADASGRKSETPDNAGPDIAQKRADQLAQSTGGTIVKADSAQTQAEWQADQASKPGAITDAVAEAKQTSYSGLQARTMIANPSMLLQAQLFAQQSMNFDAKSAMQYIPHVDDQLGGATGAFA